ncbi:LPXTG cell wall anchor domain-containing protein [[Clostridium] innocuum]|uniref:LPXTG cell wall anchor domain-containing protein n=1 Tax=Clostridium innocuum TaxID=1522 RepID=UPI001F3A1D18|nr:LPXTG cell wall anchor domain-containing protein [[Clostridium] innocuum]
MKKKQFVLQPAQGYDIADIQYDGEDITSLLQQQTLTVKGKDHDTKLIVTFCKQSQNSRKDTATVETGDSIATAGYLSIILLSAGFIIFVKKKKEKLHDRR